MSSPRSTVPGGPPPAASCPDWRRLAAARDADRTDPAGWDEAIRHLDACPHCRPAALAADPLLVFRHLPAPALAADEAEAMRLRVAALVSASRLAPSRRPLPARQLAAAAVVVVALFVGGNVPQSSAPAGSSGGVTIAAVPALDPALAAEPLLEELDRPFDHVVQWNGDDLSVVLVVDGRLGV